MNILSRRSLSLLIAASGICLLSTTLQAAPMQNGYGQECNLNDTCKMPGADGGKTLFVVSPQTGTKYECQAKSQGGKMVFWVGDEKDYSLESGGGLYTADPEATITISGRFKHPEDPNDMGLISFTRLPLTAEGEVSCKAVE